MTNNFAKHPLAALIGSTVPQVALSLAHYARYLPLIALLTYVTRRHILLPAFRRAKKGTHQSALLNHAGASVYLVVPHLFRRFFTTARTLDTQLVRSLPAHTLIPGFCIIITAICNW